MRRALWVILLVSIAVVTSLRHELVVNRDDRSPAFHIETFGFAAGGKLSITIKEFSVDGPVSQPVGFLVRRVRTDSGIFYESTEMFDCSVLPDASSSGESDFLFIPLTTEHVGSNLDIKAVDFTIPPGSEGFYASEFINCGGVPVSFEVVLTNINPGPNWLSIGESPLPWMFLIYFATYVLFTATYILFGLMKKNVKRFKIHWVLLALFIVKSMSLFSRSIEYHMLKMWGTAGAWTVFYFFFQFLKGTMMFVVIGLVGMGWSFIKPFLSSREQKVLLLVIPLQVIANFAMIILEETAPGSRGWFTWKDILRLVDIICCGAVLVPVIWSIKQLRDAAQIDGKARRNLIKLEQFRYFYLVVIIYIYVTRILLLLFDATLPYNHVWLGYFIEELSTLSFLGFVAYNFRPMEDNPYLHMDESDDEVTLVDDIEIEKIPKPSIP